MRVCSIARVELSVDWSYDTLPAVTDVFLSFQRWMTFDLAAAGWHMELQQLLFGAAVPGPAGSYLQSSSDLVRAASVDSAASEVVRSADRTAKSCSSGLTVDHCARSSLRDVLLLRQRSHNHHRRHPVSSVMQYPASQHALPAAAAIGLGSAGAPSSYYNPYYQRPSSSSSQHYLMSATSPCFPVPPDSSRPTLDSFTATMQQPVSGFSYEQHAALLRDSARLAASADGVQSRRHDTATPTLGGVELSSYCTDRRCGPAALNDCLPPVAGAVTTRYMPGGRHLQSNASTPPHTGAFSWYLRPPVTTENLTCDCICQWIDPTSSRHIKLEVCRLYAF